MCVKVSGTTCHAVSAEASSGRGLVVGGRRLVFHENLGESIKGIPIVTKCSHAMLVLQDRYKEDGMILFSLGPDKRLDKGFR